MPAMTATVVQTQNYLANSVTGPSAFHARPGISRTYSKDQAYGTSTYGPSIWQSNNNDFALLRQSVPRAAKSQQPELSLTTKNTNTTASGHDRVSPNAISPNSAQPLSASSRGQQSSNTLITPTSLTSPSEFQTQFGKQQSDNASQRFVNFKPQPIPTGQVPWSNIKEFRPFASGSNTHFFNHGVESPARRPSTGFPSQSAYDERQRKALENIWTTNGVSLSQMREDQADSWLGNYSARDTFSTYNDTDTDRTLATHAKNRTTQSYIDMTAGPDQLHRNPLSSSRIPALQSLSTIGNPSSKARAANTKVAFDTRPGDIVSQSSTARQIPIPALPKQSTSLAQSYGASGNFTYDQLEPSSHAEYVSSFYKPLTPRGAQLCDSYNNFDLAYPANEYYPIRGSQHVYDRSNMGYQWSGYTSTPTCYTNESTGYLSGQTGYYGVMNPTIAKPLDAQHIIRSPLLEEFRMAGKGKKFELRDIYDHIVEFSGDQLGSRFIQHKLEVAHSEEKERVFKELASNSRQLMTDVFGNYVIQKMFEHGTQAQKKMLASHMKGHMIALSTQTYGCRVVQTAIEHILTDQQASLIRELDGSVLAVIADQNGNHVIQRAIELLPEVHIQFIVDAHIGRVREQSKHPYGCRVMQRMLEFCSPKNTRRLLSELEKHLPELVLDAFGNYVVQHVIERGEPEDRRICIDAVNDRLLECATSKFASNVVEKALDRANDAQRQAMLRKLTGRNAAGQSQVASLLSHQFGNYVIQKCVYYLSGHALHSLLEEMDEYLNQLRQVSSGKQVSALEKSVQHADARLRKQGYLNPLQRAPTQPRTNLIHK